MNDPQPEGHMASHIERRKFLATLGGAAAAWPFAARAQQRPVIGFVRDTSLAGFTHFMAAFDQGLKEAGLIPGQNVAIEYRSVEDQAHRLPDIVADLVHQQVALIVGNTPSTLAAKAATTTVPIVFVTGNDPVISGLVASLNRPGGNATGVSWLSSAVGMSNCVVGSGGSWLPCSTIAEHSVEGCDHFSHDGDDDDLGFFVGGGEAFVEGF